MWMCVCVYIHVCTFVYMYMVSVYVYVHACVCVYMHMYKGMLVLVLVTQLCLTLWNPMEPARLLCAWDSQARILEWVAIHMLNAYFFILEPVFCPPC